MSNVQKSSINGSTERVERFITLDSGEYWKSNVNDPKNNINEGEILLLSQIDYVDDQPHTIHIRIHPSKQSTDDNGATNYAKFLSADFVANFEHVDIETARSDRTQSLDGIQKELADCQSELIEASTNQDTLDLLIARDTPKDDLEKQLPVIREALPANLKAAISSSQITDLMVTNLNEDGVQNIMNAMEHHKDIAVKRIGWIQTQTAKLSRIASKMTPYITEQSAQPIAKQQDVRDHIKELMKGIANLHLYTLKDVEIRTLKEGASAPEDIKLTVLQRPVYMDEEAAVWVDIEDDFDFESEEVFFEALSNNEDLINQVFPTERCVIGVATTRRYMDYSELSAFERDRRERENARIFLMVRDGENIHCITSNRGDLEFKERLFPSLDDLEQPFRGYDGRKITFTDLDYTSSLSYFERTALTYKRFLILFCGLDHNKKIFGDFYQGESSLDFVSQEFQEKHFNFIHDEDGTGLIGSNDRPPSAKVWLNSLNKTASKGSRLLILHDRVINSTNMPSSYEPYRHYHSYNNPPQQIFEVDTENDWYVGVIKQRGSKRFLSLPLIEYHSHRGKPKEKNGTIDADALISNFTGDFNVVCIDNIDIEEAKWYLHDRNSRVSSVKRVRLLKRIITMLENEVLEEQPQRTALKEALLEGKVVSNERVDSIINEAVSITRRANDSKSLREIYDTPKGYKSLLNQLFELARDKDEVVNTIKENMSSSGRKVLRISLDDKGKYIAYSAPLDSEIDDRVEPFAWVFATTFSLSKNGVKGSKGKFVTLDEFTNKEKVLFESDSSPAYFTKEDASTFKSPVAKKNLLDSFENYEGTEEINKILSIADSPESWHNFANEFFAKRKELTRESGNKIVVSPSISILLGYNISPNKMEKFTLTQLSFNPVKALISTIHSKDDLVRLRFKYSAIFQDSEVVLKRFDKWVAELKGAGLAYVADIEVCKVNPNESLTEDGFGWHSRKPWSVIKRKEPLLFSIDHALSASEYNEEFHPCRKFSKGVDSVLGFKKPASYRPIVRATKGKLDDNTAFAVYYDLTSDAVNGLKSKFSLEYYDTLEMAHQANNKYQKTWYEHTTRQSITATAKIVEEPVTDIAEFSHNGIHPVSVMKMDIVSVRRDDD